MTRKDYVAAAQAFKDCKPYHLGVGTTAERTEYEAKLIQWAACVDAIGDVFARDNSRFDHNRFLEAAGVST